MIENRQEDFSGLSVNKKSIFVSFIVPLGTIVILWLIIGSFMRIHGAMVFMPTVVLFIFYKYSKHKDPQGKAGKIYKALFIVASILMIVNILWHPYRIIRGNVVESGLPVPGVNISALFYAITGWDRSNTDLSTTQTDLNGNFLLIKRTISNHTYYDGSRHEGFPTTISGLNSLNVSKKNYYSATYYHSNSFVPLSYKKSYWGLFEIYDFDTIELRQLKNTSNSTPPIVFRCDTKSVDLKKIDMGSNIVPLSINASHDCVGRNTPMGYGAEILEKNLRFEIFAKKENEQAPVLFTLKMKSGGVFANDSCGGDACFSALINAQTREDVKYTPEITLKDLGVYVIKTSDGKYAKVLTRFRYNSLFSMNLKIEYQPDGTTNLEDAQGGYPGW